MYDQLLDKRIRKNKIYTFLIRWWSVGAVYFFIGWGTRLGSYTSSIDFVLMLGIVIGLFNTFIVSPTLKALFDVGPKRNYLDMTTMEHVSDRLKEVAIAIFIVYFVTVVYSLINIFAINVFTLSQETVFLPGEPILFGLFYVSIYYFLMGFIRLIIKKGNGNEI